MKAAPPPTKTREGRAQKPVQPGDATVKAADFAGREPVGQSISEVQEVSAPTPAGS